MILKGQPPVGTTPSVPQSGVGFVCLGVYWQSNLFLIQSVLRQRPWIRAAPCCSFTDCWAQIGRRIFPFSVRPPLLFASVVAPIWIYLFPICDAATCIRLLPFFSGSSARHHSDCTDQTMSMQVQTTHFNRIGLCGSLFCFCLLFFSFFLVNSLTLPWQGHIRQKQS